MYQILLQQLVLWMMSSRPQHPEALSKNVMNQQRGCNKNQPTKNTFGQPTKSRRCCFVPLSPWLCHWLCLHWFSGPAISILIVSFMETAISWSDGALSLIVFIQKLTTSHWFWNSDQKKQSHLEGFVCVKKWMVKAFGFEKETFLLWLTSVNLDAFTEAPEGLSIRLLKTITIVSSNLYVFFNDDSWG